MSRRSVEPTARSQRNLAYLLAAAFGVVVTVVWSTAVLRAANRGFDITDEGYYLLSYRWWRADLPDATGAAYMYGPVFELLRHDIAALRVFRLVTVLLTHGILGASVAGWLCQRHPRSMSRSASLAVVTLVTASGGAVFAWLPMSPGYNDAGALGALLGAAVVIRTATWAERAEVVPWRLPAGFGALAVVVVVAKWPLILAMSAMSLTAVIVVTSRWSWRPPVRLFAWQLGGAAVAVGLIQLVVVRLDRLVPKVADVVGLSADADHAPVDLLAGYWNGTVDLIRQALETHWLLVVTCLIAGAVHRGIVGWSAAVLALAALVRSVVVIERSGGFAGGSANMAAVGPTVIAFSGAVVSVALGVALRRGRPERVCVASIAVVVMLVVVPWLVAFGTNNALWLGALVTFGSGFAVLVIVQYGLPPSAAMVSGAVTATLLLTVGAVAWSGTLRHPYRGAPIEASTAVLDGGSSPLRGLRVTPEQALQMSALRRAIGDDVAPPQEVLALDKMPGLLLALGAKPLGEPWTGPTATRRSSASLRSACQDGRLSGRPVLLYNRPPQASDISALASCGWTLTDDYERVIVPGGPPDVIAYIPRS